MLREIRRKNEILTQSLGSGNFIDWWSWEGQRKYPKQHGRHIGIFYVHNWVSRIKRPWTYINDSEDRFLIYSFVYNFEQFFQLFIVCSGVSSKLVDRCLVHGPNRTTFHKRDNKDLVDSLQNDCDVLEKAVQLYIYVHPNEKSHLLEEYRSLYSKFRT